MKVIRNNVCYVETEDIVNLDDSIPDGVLSEFKTHYTSKLGFEKFTSEESVEFFKSQKSIADYDSISKLNPFELQQKIDEIYKKIERYDLEQEKNELSFEETKHLLENLKEYQLKKNEYEVEISHLVFKTEFDCGKRKIKIIDKNFKKI